MKTKNEVIKKLLLAHGDYSNIYNCGSKILAIFRSKFMISAVFQNSYIFIPLLLSEPLMMFCETQRFSGTLFEKHCFKNGLTRLGYVKVHEIVTQSIKKIIVIN